MLKVGDILWTFHENDYFVGEISSLSIVSLGIKDTYYFISTSGIIGSDRKMFIPVAKDFNTLVEIHYYSIPIYCTVSESVAVNYMREHFNETDNQRNLQ